MCRINFVILGEGENSEMEYMGTKEAAEQWGYSQNTIAKWCREGIIPNAEQDAPGSPWRIPVGEKCPKRIIIK